MFIFAAGVASAIMMLAGIGLLVYMMMRKAHLEQVQRRSRVVSDLPSLPRSKPTWQTNNETIDTAEIVRDLNGQLTTKMIVLEQLLAESQKQIDRMEELLERIEQTKNLP